MMSRLLLAGACLSSLVVSQLTFAGGGFNYSQLADDIELGYPSYGGKGCLPGTASVTLSPDAKELSILFDDYMVEAGGSGRRVVRKSCNIAIPVTIPQGFSVSIIDIDYRGYVSLPRNATAKFSAEYFFAGIRGPRYTKTYRGYTDKDFLITNTLGVTAMVWSACGDSVNLRANTSMLVRTNRYKDEALAIVDSADVSAGIVYQLQWKKCK